MKRFFAITGMLVGMAINALCGPVYFTAKGHVYHPNSHCTLLARSHNVLVADEAVAKAHGLHICTRCDPTKSPASAAAKGNAEWAQPAALPQGVGDVK